ARNLRKEPPLRDRSFQERLSTAPAPALPGAFAVPCAVELTVAGLYSTECALISLARSTSRSWVQDCSEARALKNEIPLVIPGRIHPEPARPVRAGCSIRCKVCPLSWKARSFWLPIR